MLTANSTMQMIDCFYQLYDGFRIDELAGNILQYRHFKSNVNGYVYTLHDMHGICLRGAFKMLLWQIR